MTLYMPAGQNSLNKIAIYYINKIFEFSGVHAIAGKSEEAETEYSSWKPHRKASVYRSPLRLLIIIALSVFIAEFSVMALLSIIPPLSIWTEAFVDSSLLVAILFPVFYFFFFNPLVMHIAERQKFEEALRESEEKFRNIAEKSFDIIVMADSEGRFSYVSPAVRRLLNFQPDEMIGKPFQNFLPSGSETEKAIQCFNDVIKGNICENVNVELSKKGGVSVPIEANASPIIKNGNIVGVQGIFRDITVRKKAEELRFENERLVLADKTKSKFLTMMSHEMRTPLNAILGFSEILKQKIAGELNEKQINYVDIIVSKSEYLLGLIENILDLTLFESGKLEIIIEKMSMPEAIDETLDFIRAVAEKRNIILHKEIDSGLEFIEADKRRFKQILSNLLDNAIKFSKPEGGIVTVKTIKEGEMARISVSDTGIGIKEDDTGKLFKEFEQIDSGISRKYGGTGLGLAISKKLVELHGGKITGESKYGEGSTFTILLPIKAKKREENR